MLLLLVVALLLRLHNFTESVWIDELYTTGIFVGHPLVLAKTLFSDIHPPAYFVFMHGWIAAFGDSEIAVRMPPLLFGLATLVLVQRLGSRLFSPSVGWFAAWGVALSPTHIWYCSEARPYSSNIFLAVACLWVYLRFRERAQVRANKGEPTKLGWLRACALFLILTATGWSHYYLAAIPLGFALWEVLERGPESRGRGLASAAAFLMAVGLVGFKFYASDVPTSMGYLRGFDASEWWQLWTVWFTTGNALQPVNSEGLWGSSLHAVLPYLWALLLVLGAWGVGKAQARNHLWVICLAIAIPSGLMILTLLGQNTSYIERSAIPSLPFVYLLMGVGVVRLRKVLGRAARGLDAGLLVVCGIILLAFFQRGEYWTVYKPNPNWRALSAHLVSELPSDGKTVHIYSDYMAPTPLTYYDSRLQEAKNFEFNEAKWQRAEERIGKAPILGPLLGDQIRSLCENWVAHVAETRAQTRALLHELRYVPPELNESNTEPAWLLVFGAPTKIAQQLMQDPRITLGKALHVHGLVLYPLAW